MMEPSLLKTGGPKSKPGGLNTVSNPRYSNGNIRRKHRARFKAMAEPCGICGGALGPIHYDEPSDAKHPLSFVIDEIIPISKATRFGYESREKAAEDWNNLQPAHYICNLRTRDHLGPASQNAVKASTHLLDGDW